jgi:Arc/MetJ-type ribon-helix-helix transcriptional regulator
LRLDEHLIARIEATAKKGGYSSSSAFLRALIERELAAVDRGAGDGDDRIVATLEHVAREIRGMRLGQQALFAFVDTLTKTILTCVPEPPRGAREQAVVRAKARYDRFLKTVGMGMNGDSQAALAELSRHVQAD